MNTNTAYLAVEGNDITFSYKGKRTSPVLRGLDIRVHNETIYGLLGPSGCGKTTLLRCIIGRLQLQEGELKIYGRQCSKKGFCIPGRFVGYMPQDLFLHHAITIEETLWYFGHLYNMTTYQITKRIKSLTKILQLPCTNSVIKNLSGGQKRRVSFAVALIHNPPLLLLDEPTVGLDPILRETIWNYLRHLADEQLSTIVITTHYIEEARHADVVSLMRNGRLLAEKNPNVLIQQHGLQTLEEVFLKLSKQDDTQLRSLPNFLEKTATATLNGKVTGRRSIISYQEEEKFHGSFNEHQNLSLRRIEKLNNFASYRSYGTSPEFAKWRHSPNTCSELVKEKLHHVKALVTKRFILLKRSVPLMAVHLLFPIILITNFCLFIGRDYENLPIAVVNQDAENGYGERFVNNINNKTIKQVPYTNLTLALDSTKLGQTWGTLHIGPDFTYSLLRRFLEGGQVQNETILKSSVKLYLDMTNQQITFALRRSISESYHDFVRDILAESDQNPLLGEYPVEFADPIYGVKDALFNDYIMPNMIILTNHVVALTLTCLSTILEKKEGLLERSIIAGVSGVEIISAILLSSLLILVLQVIVVLITILIFQTSIRGSIVYVFVCGFISGATGMSVGLFLSSLCDNEVTASMLAIPYFTLIALVSGSIWPIEAMGHFRYISYGLPLTSLGETIRSVMSRGWGLNDYNNCNGLLVSVGWIVVPILLSGLMFKYKM